MAERHLRAHWPAPDPAVAEIGRIVHALLHDRTITQVGEVCARFDVTPRTLQRLFQRYVGVSPKWVLRRYRLHEAGNWRKWYAAAVPLADRRYTEHLADLDAVGRGD